MKKDITEIGLQELIKDYVELKSAYKVASKHSVSATAVKRILKQAGVLRTQASAAKERDNSHLEYERTDKHRERLSQIAKTRTKDKNPFYGKKHKKESLEKMRAKAKERTGKRNPNYKDGSYQRRPRDFKQAEFTRLRNFVFNRDEYTCAYCKSFSGHLHAHHKLPYWVEPKAFLDPNNLITVCTSCHFDKAHKGNWVLFDTSIVEDYLLERYSLDRERLNELAGENPDAIVRTPAINKTGETGRND